MSIILPRKSQTVTLILSVSLLLVALFPAPLAASALTLVWDPNTEDDLAGYNVYYGTRSRDYDFVIDLGNTTHYTVTGLEPETLYYFALTAYDTSWNESDFSAEISAVTDLTCLVIAGTGSYPPNGGWIEEPWGKEIRSHCSDGSRIVHAAWRKKKRKI